MKVPCPGEQPMAMPNMARLEWGALTRQPPRELHRSTRTDHEERHLEMEGKREHIVFFHPDLGIGGAERLVIDAAVGLQSRGHKVTIFTSYCDRNHCFDEARDGKRPLLLWHLRTHAHVRTSS